MRQCFMFRLILVSLEDHSDRDCLLIAVFSHGIPNRIYASDGTYKSESLWDPFTADRCRSLAGKPKIFLIQVLNNCFISHRDIFDGQTMNMNSFCFAS